MRLLTNLKGDLTPKVGYDVEIEPRGSIATPDGLPNVGVSHATRRCTMSRITKMFATTALAISMIAGCSADRGASGTAPLAPAGASSAAMTAPVRPTTASGWVSGLSNPYLNFARGRVFNYRSVTPEGVETTVTEVTRDTKTIQGVVTTVVHDVVYLDGSIIEDTFDWYAQDTEGNVWYFGEDSKQVDHGVVIGTTGSWEAGVNGAQAGIAMLANPKVGVQYQQEFAVGVAEDQARVQSLSRSASVPYGAFDDCLVIFETTPLDKSDRAYKYYRSGLGLLLTTEDKGNIRDELISIQH